MRLIDAEIIDDYLGDLADEWYESEEGHGDDFMDGYCWTLNRLQDEKRFPTVDAIPTEWIKNRIETLNEYISKWGGSFEHDEMVNAYIHEVSALVRLIADWTKED